MKEKLKVNLSIFELLLRNGGLKLAAVILLTMLTEGVLLYTMMQKETLYYENLFARGAAIPLMAGFILLSLAMLNPMKASKSNLNYTLKRLRVKPAAIFAAEAVYLMLAYAVFWALAIALLYGFGAYFAQTFRRHSIGKPDSSWRSAGRMICGSGFQSAMRRLRFEM